MFKCPCRVIFCTFNSSLLLLFCTFLSNPRASFPSRNRAAVSPSGDSVLVSFAGSYHKSHGLVWIRWMAWHGNTTTLVCLQKGKLFSFVGQLLEVCYMKKKREEEEYFSAWDWSWLEYRLKDLVLFSLCWFTHAEGIISRKRGAVQDKEGEERINNSLLAASEL